MTDDVPPVPPTAPNSAPEPVPVAQASAPQASAPQASAPQASVPQASVHRPRRFSIIWLLPVVAAIVAGYLGWQALSARGPTITISFRSADGLKAGQTKVLHKAVELGTVEKIKLSEDLSHVIVTVQMSREATPQLTEKTNFWVVRPRLSAGNISGLDTLVSGAFIEIDPGAKTTEAQAPLRDFTGLDDPPAVRSDEPGLTYVLKTRRLAGISTGSPVIYRDLTVGEVLSWELAPDGVNFTVNIFVRRPFARFIHDGTFFYNSSGIAVELGANGVQLHLESLQALLSGAVAFDTTPQGRETPISVGGRVFPLFRDRALAEAAGYARRLAFTTSFQGSVRGLAEGAPVEVYGMPVGLVTGVHLKFDPSGMNSRVDVNFEIQPERILSVAEIDKQSPLEVTRTMVKRGLRAQLHTANYLTGQLVLGMDFIPNAPPGEVEQREGGVLYIPGVTGGLDGITSSLSDVLRKVDAIPFDQIGRDLSQTLQGVSALAGGPELKQSLQALSATLASLQGLVGRIDTGITPVMKRLPEIAQSLQATVDRANRLVGSVDSGYGGNSQFRRDLERTLAQLSDTARSIRLLADYLSQHPEALIQGRTGRASER